jgi:hypothetical protein
MTSRRTFIKQAAAAGINMVVIDLGDGVEYESHPEIAVKNAWKPEKLRNELVRMRKLGIEPIPKLNFATQTRFDYAVVRQNDLWWAELSQAMKKFYPAFK